MVKDQKRWRLLKDLKKGKFCFLIGVDNWSIELQKSEFNSLYLLLLRINEQLLVIKDELMDEESITLELENLPWFIQLEGKKNEWSLRFVFDLSLISKLIALIVAEAIALPPLLPRIVMIFNPVD